MALQALTSIKAHAVSDDGNHVALAFAKRDGGELSVMIPADCLEELIAGLYRAKTAVRNKQSKNADQISVAVPKTWMITADVNVRGVVLLVFDPKTESQVGYALDPEASKKMAVGLVQNADAIIKHKTAKKV